MADGVGRVGRVEIGWVLVGQRVRCGRARLLDGCIYVEETDIHTTLALFPHPFHFPYIFPSRTSTSGQYIAARWGCLPPIEIPILALHTSFLARWFMYAGSKDFYLYYCLGLFISFYPSPLILSPSPSSVSSTPAHVD